MVVAGLLPGTALGCSAMYISSLADLGKDQIFLVGTIGERFAGVRTFHVERSFNGTVPASEIVIVFKEGPPIGDCSYYPVAGTRVFIAPYREADGRLHAVVVTIQVHPDSEAGKAYIAEVMALYGPGNVPPEGVADGLPSTTHVGSFVTVGVANVATLVWLILAWLVGT